LYKRKRLRITMQQEVLQMKIETKCIQSGYTPKNGEPRVLPIYQSTTWKYASTEQMGRLFDLEESGYFYTRLANPTNDAVAAKIADLEGGVAAMLTSSGQAACFYSIFNICEAGGHFVCSTSVYGGTFNLFGVTLKKLGIDVTFVDPDADEETLNAAFRENTKAVFGETIANPALVVLDIEKWAKAAHAHGVPLIIDNTFATPINCRPFEWGADIVVHSTTKYMDGHATSVGGVVVDSGNFDWEASGKFPGLTTPDESYHGITYTKKFGKAAYITKLTAQVMRDLGSIPSPHNAFLLNIGLETLPLRMERHCSNAQAVAEFLEKDDRISWVKYCGLEGDKYHQLAKKYLPNGSCGVISFGVKGGREAAVKFMDSLKLAAIVTHVADARTSVLHPASHTHRQLSDSELEAAGVTPDLIRFSVGIENIDDIIDDIKQALDAVK
jgi:O-acetylhomoserine (thiol)-lyase